MKDIDWRKTEYKALVEAVLALKNRDEAERFLRDLLTPEEIEEFAGRYKTACLLTAEVPYSEIKTLTGMSTTTIARVSKWLQGELGGYRTIIARLHHDAPISRERGVR
ncbi:MAG TPA: YerC/YecD family TrpR-related protein [Candidatus Paceibacterota bacterium]|nr:YerC/YecD family TrpR-related protein [Candidatus Paceibacterota bacterium]